MKWLHLAAFLLFCSISKADLPFKDQVKLIASLIATSGVSLETVVVGIHGGSDTQRKELQAALDALKSLKVGNKTLPLQTRLLTSDTLPEDLNVLYVFTDIQIPKDRTILSFTNNEDLVGKGVLAGLTQQGVQPKIFMNMETLKLLGLKYPASLLKMVTLVRN